MPVPINTRKPGNFLKMLLTIMLLIVVTAGLTFLINRYLIRPNLTLKQPVTILLVGEDAAKSTGQFPRMNALVLAFISPEDPGVSLISIPGESQVDPLHAETRISDANRNGGISYAEKSLSKLTRTKINHYMALDCNGFQKLVDILGGVKINVIRPIESTGKPGRRLAGIYPGKQLLNGKQALLYAKFLDSKGEVDRINRQQVILTAMLGKLARPGSLFNSLKIYRAIKKYVRTDLTPKELLQLAALTKSIDLRNDVSVAILPGAPEADYWKPDCDAIGRMITRLNPAN